MERFGIALKRARIARNMDQEQLADLSGINRTYISKIETGRAEAIRELLTTEDMAALLGVSRRRVQALAKRRGIGWSVGRDILFRPEDIERMQPGLPGRPSRA